MALHEPRLSFAGRRFTAEELALIREVVGSCSGLSRMELAHTVCELVGWKRPRGSLKGRECREFLERLDTLSVLTLPDKLPGRPTGSHTRVPHTDQGEPGPERVGTVGEFGPIVLEPVVQPEEHLLYRELVGRYHYLGHRVPYGAHHRYLVFVSRPERQVVGCLQFSSPAWRIAVRDRWIGWDDATRQANLQRLVNNSRFLLLPWVRVRNLASTVLSLAVRRLAADWRERYAVEPLLVETLVDPGRYTGGCYGAANWLCLGSTSGRGRMDRTKQGLRAEPKLVFVYPLVADAVRKLKEAAA